MRQVPHTLGIRRGRSAILMKDGLDKTVSNIIATIDGSEVQA